MFVYWEGWPNTMVIIIGKVWEEKKVKLPRQSMENPTVISEWGSMTVLHNLFNVNILDKNPDHYFIYKQLKCIVYSMDLQNSVRLQEGKICFKFQWKMLLNP